MSDQEDTPETLAYAIWNYCRSCGAEGLPAPDLIARFIRWRADREAAE